MKRNIVILAAFLAVTALSFTSCDGGDDYSVENKEYAPDSTNSLFPILIDEDHPAATVVIGGKTITIHYGENNDTCAIENEQIYPKDHNATLASIPRLAQKGEYVKYAVKRFPPFSALNDAKIAMVRLDKFTFQCNAPANANIGFKITNITKQGFATKDANLKGYAIDNIIVATDAVIMNCHFYIQNGIAYGAGGKRLTSDTPYPLAGNEVRYQFTYEMN